MTTQQSRTRAVCVFPEELNAIDQTFKEQDAETAPRYGLLPSGVRVNRVMIAGTLTDWEPTNGADTQESHTYYHARIVDFRGDIAHVYTGQYQPDATESLRTLEPPVNAFLVGKPHVYAGDDGTVYTSVQPEYIVERSAPVRYAWTIHAAQQTLERIDYFQNNPDDMYVEWARDMFGDVTEELTQVVLENLQQSIEFRDKLGIDLTSSGG